jgi:hypothetical protein
MKNPNRNDFARAARFRPQCFPRRLTERGPKAGRRKPHGCVSPRDIKSRGLNAPLSAPRMERVRVGLHSHRHRIGAEISTVQYQAHNPLFPSRCVSNTGAMKPDNAARRWLSTLGRKGGRATARRLSPQQRRASAHRAINGRWSRQETDMFILLRELTSEVRDLSSVSKKRRSK